LLIAVRKQSIQILITSKNNSKWPRKNLNQNRMTAIELIICHTGFALWFYVGYKIGKRK
jgi:hypothetical protein